MKFFIFAFSKMTHNKLKFILRHFKTSNCTYLSEVRFQLGLVDSFVLYSCALRITEGTPCASRYICIGQPHVEHFFKINRMNVNNLAWKGHKLVLDVSE